MNKDLSEIWWRKFQKLPQIKPNTAIGLCHSVGGLILMIGVYIVDWAANDHLMKLLPWAIAGVAIEYAVLRFWQKKALANKNS